MTEKEKAEAGLLYNANYDIELQKMMRDTRTRLFEYNNISPAEEDKRESFIKSLFGKCGCHPIVISPFYCDYGSNIEVGDNFFANTNLVILDGAKVKIGNNVFIAPHVGIYTAGHPLDVAQRNEGLEYAYPITIGDNVWIGAGVSILPGVTIGNDTVIGAGSLVNRDIPSGVVAAGNPCKVIRKITEEDKYKYK